MSIENIEKATHGTYYVGSRDERDTVVIRRAADQFRELDLRLDLAPAASIGGTASCTSRPISHRKPSGAAANDWRQ
jgi:hypothetical protein